MLDLFRKRGLSSVVYSVLVVAMVIVFMLQFNTGQGGMKLSSLKEACVANVYGRCIDPRAFRTAHRVLTPRDPDAVKASKIKKVALDGLIERELLVREAERLGLTVTEQEVTESIFGGYLVASLPAESASVMQQLGMNQGRMQVGFRDKKTQQFDQKVYERQVRALTGGRTPTEFREWQERELLAAKMRDLIKAPVRVSDREAESQYIQEKSTATLGYVAIKASFVGKYSLHPTPAEIDAWAKDKANKEQIDAALKQPAHIRHILIKFSSERAPEAEKTAAKARLMAALLRVRAGESFEDVARQVSEDTGSATQGGDVGTDTESFVKPFKEAADKLKSGEMTMEPVETQFGYHAIMKDDLAKTVPRELYLKAKGNDIAKDLANKLLAEVKSGTKLEDAVKNIIASVTRTYETTRKPEPKAKPVSADGGAPPSMPKLTPDTDPDRPIVLSTGSFNRGGEALPSASNEVNQNLLKFAFNGKEGDTFGEVVRSEDAFIVAQLKERHVASKEDYERERDTYIQTMLSAKQGEALTLELKRLRDAAKADIKTDESYLSDTKKDGGAPSTDEEE